MALPLVLVPGLMCDGATWTPLLPTLQASGRVGSIVLIDHGHCDSLKAMAEQLLATAPPRFALAGHSMGGRVALEVCRLAPDRVSHLAVLDSGHAPLADGEPGRQEALKRQVLPSSICLSPRVPTTLSVRSGLCSAGLTAHPC